MVEKVAALATAGPWTLTREKNDKAVAGFSYKGADVFEVHSRDWGSLALVACGFKDSGEGAANAALIAAAPDMFTVLKSLLRAYDGPTVDAANAVSGCITAVRAAVAKAEGKAP